MVARTLTARHDRPALEPLAVIRRRLRRQHLTGPRLREPRDVVAWLVAMQADEALEREDGSPPRDGVPGRARREPT